MRTRIKVCCIMSADELRAAVAAGADSVGFVADMPSGPGQLRDDRIAALNRAAPPPVTGILLTRETKAFRIVDHARLVGAAAVQLVAPVDAGELDLVAEIEPGLRRLQVVHVEEGRALDAIDDLSAHVDAFVLDSGKPADGELGGTGRTHDWSVSARFVRESPRPVFLAGGLTPANVRDAIATVRPYAVDVCSGVRRDGRLDERLLAAFVEGVMDADAALRAARPG